DATSRYSRYPRISVSPSLLLVFYSFFSSRRRHTRCYRDWSSDVCSSDLGAIIDDLNIRVFRTKADLSDWNAEIVGGERVVEDDRSEERRVGKECRARWGRERYREKRVWIGET